MPLPVTTTPRARPSLVGPNEIWLANGSTLANVILNGSVRLIPETDLVIVTGCDLTGCDLSALTWDQLHSSILRDCRLPTIPDGWPLPPSNGPYGKPQPNDPDPKTAPLRGSNMILTTPGRISSELGRPADQENKP